MGQTRKSSILSPIKFFKPPFVFLILAHIAPFVKLLGVPTEYDLQNIYFTLFYLLAHSGNLSVQELAV